MATNEVLKALLENELLTDDVKQSVTEAFDAIVEEQKQLAEEKATKEAGIALNEALDEAKTEMEAKVRTELATKFVSEKEELIKTLDETVQGLLTSEIEDLKEDISKFRDLEVEFAAKLEDEKESLAETFADEKKVFITKIDEFVETRLTAEMQELNEDIQHIKQNEAGMKIFEAFKATHEDLLPDSDGTMASVKATISELEAKNVEVMQVAEALGTKVVELQRASVLETTLAPLSGKRKAVMESILLGYKPEQFGKVYEKMVGRVMDTVPADAEENSDDVVSEDASTDNKDEVVTEEDLPENVEVVDGDSRLTESEELEDEVVVEGVDMAAEKTKRLKTLAGIN